MAEFGLFFSHAGDAVHVSEPPPEHVVYFYALHGSLGGERGRVGICFVREVTIPGSLNPPDSINFSSQYANDDVHLMTRVDVTRLPSGSLQFVALRRGADDRFHRVDQMSVALSGRLQVEFRTFCNHRKVPVDFDQLDGQDQVGTLVFHVERRRPGEEHLDQGPFASNHRTIAHVATSGTHGNHREKWVVTVVGLADHLHNDVQFREKLAMVSPHVKATKTHRNVLLPNVLFTVGPQTYLLHPTPESQTKNWGIFPYPTHIV